MNWKIWAHKLIVGLLLSVALTALAYFTNTLKDLDPSKVGPYGVLIILAIQHLIGMAQNYLKHYNDPVVKT
jgi:heme/copper-type cytochrome/quinol oxidase subunit 4